MQGELLPSDVDKINDTLTNIRVQLGEIKTMLTNVDATSEDHETRIRRMERTIWIAAGVAAALGNADTVIQLIGGG